MTKNYYQLRRKNNLQKDHCANDLLIIVPKIGGRALLFTTSSPFQPSQRVYFLHTHRNRLQGTRGCCSQLAYQLAFFIYTNRANIGTSGAADTSWSGHRGVFLFLSRYQHTAVYEVIRCLIFHQPSARPISARSRRTAAD
jgi:hypothetical protein